ncbi:(R)-specific enoyl-CoA hydratase [Anaerococcus prevotii]|uniref:MaoC domain protein dehydratase n=1 Tax=Anaerococcus prevotii (strain ATCC 9321 / DSM 20548 / JCM 6508 / NCTC 11806 / PC1) TaxID=525919 RepID=C7RFA6_ANAPD|nr:MaoC domain protein dehydratase [Anaerococcus prevotii DSM 20548]SUU93721.1 (R)-specific enoyl-CoA hydratase [Anaerococcus prevotii]
MENIKGYTIDEVEVGQSASFTKTVTEADAYNYAGVSGDFNPAHINEEYAKNTFFKTRIAHGMISAGFISAVLGTKLPGPGTIYLGQDLKFLKPVRFGDTITATCTVEEIIKEKNRLTLRTVCTNQDGEVVIDGKALVLAPK